MSALNVLFAHPGGASDAVAAAVRSTVATPAVAGGLLAALDAVHSLDWAAPSAKDVAKLAAGRAPETYVPMLLQELARSDFSRFGTLVCRTPALKGRAPPTGPAPGVRRHVAGFAAALCRMAPAETLAALRQPLTDWSELTPKVCGRCRAACLSASQPGKLVSRVLLTCDQFCKYGICAEKRAHRCAACNAVR